MLDPLAALAACALGLALATSRVAGLAPSASQSILQVVVLAAAASAHALAQASIAVVLAVAAVAVVVAQYNTFVGNLALLAARAEHVLRPLMCRLLPTRLVVFIYSSSRGWFLWALSSANYGPFDGNTYPVEVLGMRFRNDLGNAAGLDKDGTMLDWFWRSGAGFAVVGTVLDTKHTGNLDVLKTWNPWVPLPQSGGGLNSLGLPSKGVDPALKNIAAFRERLGDRLVDFPIGLSVMGHPAQHGERKLQGVLDCVRKACGGGGGKPAPVDFIEINESCPNVAHASEGADELAERLRRIVSVRDECAAAGAAGTKPVPLLVKLGSLGDVEHTLLTMEGLRIDGIVGLNTQKDYASFEAEIGKDMSLLRNFTQDYNGGLSGRPIAGRALSQMQAAAAVIKAKKLKIQLVHVGGIQDAADMQSSRDAGAHLREWYTGLMHAVATVPAPLLYACTTPQQAATREPAAASRSRSRSRVTKEA